MSSSIVSFVNNENNLTASTRPKGVAVRTMMRNCRTPFLVLFFTLLLTYTAVLYWDRTRRVSTPRRHTGEGSDHREARPEDEDRISKSMVLSLDYYEQTANAMRNLMDLQCWARTVNITGVVEPSVFSLPGKAFHFSSTSNFTFRDYFDIDQWNFANLNVKNSILVSLKYFIENSHKRIIFVQLKYSAHKPCQSVEALSENQWFQYLESHGFHIKTTCILVKFSITEDAFFRKIFSSTDDFRHASIMFDQWRGTGQVSYRLKLSGSRCLKKVDMIAPIKSNNFDSLNYPIAYSKRLLNYCYDFVSKHLDGMKYIVVMVRTEKLDFSIISDTDLARNSCIKQINYDVKQAQRKTRTTQTLYFTDSGSHGTSAVMYQEKKKHVAAIFCKYLEKTIDPIYSAKESSKKLELVTKSQDSILISLVQSALAAKADALVIVGGGSFQALTKSMYGIAHGGPKLFFSRDKFCSQQTYT